MIFKKQLFFHRPEEGQFGDCDRTCIACLLNKEPQELPNWGIHYNDVNAFHQTRRDYLLTQDLAYCEISAEGTLQEILDWRKAQAPGVLYMLGGRSRNGTNHVVIAVDGKIIWDPAIDNSGIVGPCDDGYYWVSYLVSTKFLAKE